MVNVFHFNNICGIGWLFGYLGFVIDGVGGSFAFAFAFASVFAFSVAFSFFVREEKALGG